MLEACFFVKIFLKVLKGFVRDQSRTKGHMGKGIIVEELFFYTTKYTFQINPSTPKMWNANKDKKIKRGDFRTKWDNIFS